MFAVRAVGLLLTPACAVGAAQVPFVFSGVSGPLIIAHRGGALEAPENTVAAVTHAIAAGADWQEVDVRLSADGEPVVIHDATLERTTNGQGLVAAQPWAQLRRLRAGNGFTGFAEEPLPHLRDVLAIADARLFIELKVADERQVAALVRAVLAVVDAQNMRERVAIGSFSPAALWEIYDRAPDIARVGIAGSPEDAHKLVLLPIQVLCLQQDHVEQLLPQLPAGLALWAWTATTGEQVLAARALGARGIVTDIPAAAFALLRPTPSLYMEPAVTTDALR